MLRIAVCDNEESCREALMALIPRLPFPAECRCFADGGSLLAACGERENAFDLVFMDIELDGGESGIAAASGLKRLLPDVILIFVSGYPRYFTEAFKLQPDQLLVKPVQAGDFLEAVNSAMALRSRRESMVRFSFQLKNKLATFRQDEICYLEASGHYIRVVTTRDAPFLIASTITRQEERFLPHSFVKVHRSYLVNLRHIRHIESRDIIMESGERIPISKGYYQQVFDRYTAYISAIIGGLL